jgi:uncharacterized protein (TIGR02757 family)
LQKKPVTLKAVYDKYSKHLTGHILKDPVEFIQRYADDREREIAGFLASQFAYGKIETFKAFLEKLFGLMGKSPYRFIRKGDFSKVRGLYYRFQKDKDITLLLATLRVIIDEFGGIGAMLRHYYRGDIRETLWAVREHLFRDGNELTFFFPKPSPTNPLKRWSLYLRWMVRKDAVDIGIWDFIDRRDLIMPLDTHIFKIGRCIGWTQQRTPSYKAAREITGALKAFSPDDPLKYDLFLCHKVGIGAGCTGKRTPACKDRCLLYGTIKGSR